MSSGNNVQRASELRSTVLRNLNKQKEYFIERSDVGTTQNTLYVIVHRHLYITRLL